MKDSKGAVIRMCQQTGKISLSKEFFGGKECAIEVKVNFY